MYIPLWLIVLAIIIGFFYFRNKKKVAAFAPFSVTILPNWETLLKDYKLADEKKVEELSKIIYGTSKEYNVLKNGITFTVLQSKQEDDDLIYNNNRNTFHSEVEFDEHIEELKIKNSESPFGFTPEFYVKWGIGGYAVGITTPESSKKVIMAGDDNDRVEITTIPYALFNMPKYRFGVVKPEQLEEMLNKNGWKRDETNESFRSDVLFDVPVQLNHKYFTLYYRYI